MCECVCVCVCMYVQLCKGSLSTFAKAQPPSVISEADFFSSGRFKVNVYFVVDLNRNSAGENIRATSSTK